MKLRLSFPSPETYLWIHVAQWTFYRGRPPPQQKPNRSTQSPKNTRRMINDPTENDQNQPHPRLENEDPSIISNRPNHKLDNSPTKIPRAYCFVIRKSHISTNPKKNANQPIQKGPPGKSIAKRNNKTQYKNAPSTHSPR